MFWPISGLITSEPCYLTLEETHCKIKWVTVLVTTVSYPFPHGWTIAVSGTPCTVFDNTCRQEETEITKATFLFVRCACRYDSL